MMKVSMHIAKSVYKFAIDYSSGERTSAEMMNDFYSDLNNIL